MIHYLAHSKNDNGIVHLLKDHLFSTSNIAFEFGKKIDNDFALHAKFCGLLHDLGKYGDLFQKRLLGLESRIDHWSAGSICSLIKGHKASSLVIEGHHLGLKSLEKSHLETLNLDNLLSNHPQKRRLSSSSINELFKRLLEDGIKVDFPIKQFNYSIKDVAGMFDVRMLFSTLVDADFIDTENHFTSDLKNYSVNLEPEKALKILKDFIVSTSAESKSAPLIKSIREGLLQSCLEASQSETGVFTLTSPTGSGKTLSLLAFALSHAIKNSLERIILVIPYLSIIDQTSKIYRDIFTKKHFDNSYIFEHHSLSNQNNDVDELDEHVQASQSINWDAPIILTTNVQLLQSMFSNKPSSSRKLHRFANSIIMFDEVQTMPTSIIIPSLASLSHLSTKYHSTIVFSTATQPAFTNLNNEIINHCDKGWLPNEIVSNNLSLFEKSKRVEVKWPVPDFTLSRNKLADKIANANQILVILNTKKELSNIYQLLKDSNQLQDVFFLSTNLVQEHRQEVLKIVKGRLDNNQPIKLISTQCIEAGVDVDFPYVVREFSSLDSITQAAGRCNRNGNLEKGTLEVILLDNPTYPSEAYKQAIDVSLMLLKNYNNNLDIDNPKIHLEYYKMLYDLTKCHEWEELKKAINILNFEDVANLFKVIEQDTINILVPYNKEIFTDLADQVRNPLMGLTRRWQRKASKQSVSIYRPKLDAPIMSMLETIRVSRTDFSNEWFIASDVVEYDSLLGLVIPKSSESIIIA